MCLNSIKKLLTVSLTCLAGIGYQNSQAADSIKIIRLTTTTSVISSGLFDKLRPAFEADSGYTVEVEAYGTGRALRSARDGHADVLIAHSPAAELKFMASGYGLERIPLMKNEFILAGPEHDPACVTDVQDIAGAFKAVARNKAGFVSRGDDSGTHKKELEIWSKSNIEPYGRWYIEYGHGMGETLFYADKMNAYTLVDKGTWLAKHDRLKLVTLFSGDALLDNPYHIISINPSVHPSVNAAGAAQFIEWMTSKKGQDMIENLTISGEQLYIPASHQ